MQPASEARLRARLRTYARIAGATAASAAPLSADVIVFDNLEVEVGSSAVFVDVDGGQVDNNTFLGADFQLRQNSLRGLIAGNAARCRTVYLNSCCTCSSISTLGGALSLPDGTVIGPGDPFNCGVGNFFVIGSLSTSSSCTVAYPEMHQDGERGFIGLRFKIGGVDHHGWLDVTYTRASTTLHRMGYESTASTAIETPGPCPDATGDGQVDLSDLAVLLSQFGSGGAGLASDFNEDGTVDLSDLALLLALFGGSC